MPVARLLLLPLLATPAICTLPFIESAVTWAPKVTDALTATARHQLGPGSGGRPV